MTEIDIYLRPKENINLPVAKSNLLQGLFYNLLSGRSDLSDALHNMQGNRNPTYKYFCFGNLHGKYSYSERTGKLTYTGPLQWKVRSAADEIIQTIAIELDKRGMVRLGKFDCAVSSYVISMRQFFCDEIAFKMDMPIAVYRQERENEKRVFLSPENERFYEIAENNLVKKYKIFYGTESAPPVRFLPLRVAQSDKTVVKYKGGYITGWGGEYVLKSSPAMLELAYYSGIGAKNPQGFGTIEIID